MMKKLYRVDDRLSKQFLYCFIVYCCILWLPQQGFSQKMVPLHDSITTHLSRFLDSVATARFAEHKVPGCVLVVTHDTSVLFAKGYGYADLQKHVPFSPDRSVFRIASVSKLFTAIAVMQCVQRGELDMHTDITRYLTTVKIKPAFGKPITLHDLLTHTAGIDERTIGKSSRTVAEQQPLGEFLAKRLPERILPPGEVCTYSNFSNSLAADVLEEKLGKDFAEYIRENILLPLGMNLSGYRLTPEMESLLSTGYAYDGNEVVSVPFDFLNDYPGGQMLSTASDMAKFMIACNNSGRYAGVSILDSARLREMQSVQFTHHPLLQSAIGYGFSVNRFHDRLLVGHDGGYMGTTTRLMLFPESRLGFFIECNILDEPLAGEITDAFLMYCFPQSPPDTVSYPLKELPPFDPSVDAFVGTYRQTRYSHTTFEKIGALLGFAGFELPIWSDQNGKLMMYDLGGKPRRMIQIQPAVFRSIDDDYYIAFRKTADGSVTHLFTNGTTAFEKISLFDTIRVQRALFVVCMVIFGAMAIVSPLVRRFKKERIRLSLSSDRVQWLAEQMSSMFLYYPLAMGLSIIFFFRRLELVMGFPYGMHWSMYIVQSIPFIAMIFLAWLVIVTVRSFQSLLRTPLKAVKVFLSVASGCTFVWFLYTWNLFGFKF